MKVTLTRDQVSEMKLCLQGALEQGVNFPYKWKYALSKNIDKLESEEKAIIRALAPKPAFEEYNKERVALAEKYCDKDDNGQSLFIGDNITVPKQYKITIHRHQWQKELDEIEAKPEYKELIAERNRINSEEFRNETQEYDLHEIRVSKEEQEQLEKGEIVIPGGAFRYTTKIMVEVPGLQIV